VAASATPPPAKTQVFVNLGADIVVERGPDKGKEFALYQQVTTIGRVGTRKNDIELNDDTVSKEQAAIYYDNAKRLFSIVNESATNPTKVNGAVIASPTLLENGTLVELGRTVLVFRKG
jgi:pSer/pThr/pTyr-binding forkhead associated (FHA) protein